MISAVGSGVPELASVVIAGVTTIDLSGRPADERSRRRDDRGVHDREDRFELTGGEAWPLLAVYAPFVGCMLLERRDERRTVADGYDVPAHCDSGTEDRSDPYYVRSRLSTPLFRVECVPSVVLDESTGRSHVGTVLRSVVTLLLTATPAGAVLSTGSGSSWSEVVPTLRSSMGTSHVPSALDTPWMTVLAPVLDPTRIVVLQSVNRELIDGLYRQLLFVALPLTLLALGILVYVVVRFRDNDESKPTDASPTLAITWTIVVAIVLLFVGISSYAVLADPYISPGIQSEMGADGTDENPVESSEEDVVVEVVASQWEWEFTDTEANVTTQNELVLPADENVTLRLTSRDVIHSFAISDLGVRQEVYPGAETVVRTNAHATGEYDAQCTEFCGTGHATMRANVTVVDEETYEEWLDANREESGVTEAPR